MVLNRVFLDLAPWYGGKKTMPLQEELPMDRHHVMVTNVITASLAKSVQIDELG